MSAMRQKNEQENITLRVIKKCFSSQKHDAMIH